MKIVIGVIGLVVIALATYVFLYPQKRELTQVVAPVTEEVGEEKIVAIPIEQLDPVSDFAPSETYRGTDSTGGEIVFRQQDGTRYELSMDKIERCGDLNTERGWQDDADATVYILNWQRPIEEQIVFVRLTATPKVLTMLDASRKPVNPPITLNLAD
jgi:hypothetical protein